MLDFYCGIDRERMVARQNQPTHVLDQFTTISGSLTIE
jgi:hypothetical protein